MLPPCDVVLSTSRVFTLGYIGWVYGEFKPATYIIYGRSLNGKQSGRRSLRPLLSILFIYLFILVWK